MTMQLEMNLQDDAALVRESNASHTPAIRFKGFSGAWEVKALGEITSKIGSGKTPRGGSSTYTLEGIPLLRSQNIFNNLVNIDDVAYITPQTHEDMQNSSVIQNDVLLNITGASIGRSAVYSRLSEANVNQHVCIIRLTREYESKFTQLLLASSKGQQQIDNNQAGGAREGLNFQHIARMVFGFASLNEQTAIGNYFQQLDSLIAQHQHKHTKLLNLKQALLQKMFPKQGATVPEVRFKGFSGDWEEQKWRDSVDISREMVDPKNGLYDELFHIGPGNIESFTGKIYNNVLRVKDSNLISGKFYFKKGDIIYGKINPQLAKQIIAPFEGLASADAYILNAKNETAQSYLYVILQTGNFYKYSVSVSARTGMPKINREELDLYTYKAPKKLEQTAIGQLFQQLDHLITQQNALLTKLGNLKQAYLAKMFV